MSIVFRLVRWLRGLPRELYWFRENYRALTIQQELIRRVDEYEERRTLSEARPAATLAFGRPWLLPRHQRSSMWQP
jgi:hypothetical protein